MDIKILKLIFYILVLINQSSCGLVQEKRLGLILDYNNKTIEILKSDVSIDSIVIYDNNKVIYFQAKCKHKNGYNKLHLTADNNSRYIIFDNLSKIKECEQMDLEIYLKDSDGKLLDDIFNFKGIIYDPCHTGKINALSTGYR